jgi:hypothetical protein
MKTNNNLRLNYTDIDDFFDDEIEPTELSGSLRELHVSFTRAQAILANNNLKLQVPDHLINNLESIENFCGWLDCLQVNPESSREEDPDQSGSGPARCPNCDNKDKINSLLEKLLKEKEEEIDELKSINSLLKEKVDSLEKKGGPDHEG